MTITKNNIIDVLSQVKDYKTKEETYSPFFSSIGLTFDNSSCGVDNLWLHFNRFTRPMWSKLIDINESYNKEASTIDKIVFGDNKAKLAFFDTDCFIFETKEIATATLLKEPTEQLIDFWLTQTKKDTVLIQGYSENGDARDPDKEVGFIAGIKAVKGTLAIDAKEIVAEADKNNELSIIFVFEFLTATENSVLKKLNNCRVDVNSAALQCADNIKSCFDKFELTANTDTEKKIIAKALHGLIFNLCRAPGALRKYISSYPNRGTYPTHFLWDTCFQNLAYEEMSDELVKNFLLQFTANQRADGKYPQFLCSTWARPDCTQPALMGWATERFTRNYTDRTFIKTMFESLERNNDWWFSARMTSYGVICCPHGLETGQDDSPRFDNGPTLAVDMNSYLLNQLYSTATLADKLGYVKKAAYWRKKADRLSSCIINTLYCSEDNLFYDVDPKTGKFIKILSPVSFMPLWAGVKLPDRKGNEMIEKYLLSPEHLFGDVPFPSVAYTDINYSEGLWWRGPTWMSEAWITLETLQKCGYEKEMLIAYDRFYKMLLNDTSMHELFNSKTGEGLGSAEQGWTCAVFIKLCKFFNK